MAIKYTYSERMAFELGLQTAKTALQDVKFLTPKLREAIVKQIEGRANDCHSEMRVLEPARTGNTNLN